MTRKEFAEGVALVELCMQGVVDELDREGRIVKHGTSFIEGFLDYLFVEVKDIPRDLWLKVCEKVCRLPCRPRDLTVSDFLRGLESFRAAEVWRKARWKMAPPGPMYDRKLVYERVLADPSANELSKSLARRGLERIAIGGTSGPGEGKCPRVQGGEKYRQMKMHKAVSEETVQGCEPQPESEGEHR